MTEGDEDQLELLPPPARAKAMARKAKPPPEKKPVPVATVDPVARVLVDVPLAHLDRPFDYAVPETMAADAQPGVRVKVRFAGQDVDGFVVERAATTDHTGRLQPLRRVVSAEPVLAADVTALTGAVAERYAGTRSDVLRLAVPPRHATVEKQESEPAPPVEVTVQPAAAADYTGGPGLLGSLLRGRVATRRLDGPARRRLGRPARRGSGRHRGVGPRSAGLPAGPPGRRAPGRRADRAAGGGPPRRAGSRTPDRRAATARS